MLSALLCPLHASLHVAGETRGFTCAPSHLVLTTAPESDCSQFAREGIEVQVTQYCFYLRLRMNQALCSYFMRIISCFPRVI